MPNLEQTGLLRIRYRDLPEVAADAEAWDGCHYALRDDDPEHRRGDRRRAARRAAPQPGHRRRVPQRRRLRPGPAAVRAAPEGAVVAARARAPAVAGVAFPGPGKRGQRRSNVYLSGRGQFGRFLIREYANRKINLKTADAQEIITDLFSVLSEAGLLTVAVPARRRRRCRLPAARRRDPLAGRDRAVRRGRPGAAHPGQRGRPAGQPVLPRPVPGRGRTLAGLRAKEHTAQVPPPTGRSASASSARRPCRCCTARRRWNSAWTSTR